MVSPVADSPYVVSRGQMGQDSPMRWLALLPIAPLLVGCEEEGPDSIDPAPPGEPYKFLALDLSCEAECEAADWDVRLMSASDLISETEADIVAVMGLVETAQVRDLVALSTTHAARYFGDAEWYDRSNEPFSESVLLYRKSRFRMVLADALWLSPTPAEPYSKFDDQDSPRVRLFGSFDDRLKTRWVEASAENLSGVAPEHIPTKPRQFCGTGPRGVVLPVALGDERFDELGLVPTNALEQTDSVTLDPPYDEPDALDGVRDAILIDFDDDGHPCSEIYSARVTPLPWGAAAVLVETRETWKQYY